jgi:hypothetical protein
VSAVGVVKTIGAGASYRSCEKAADGQVAQAINIIKFKYL